MVLGGLAAVVVVVFVAVVGRLVTRECGSSAEQRERRYGDAPYQCALH
jgi:hypothetical protein